MTEEKTNREELEVLSFMMMMTDDTARELEIKWDTCGYVD